MPRASVTGTEALPSEETLAMFVSRRGAICGEYAAR
jgi:hypothetical protein